MTKFVSGENNRVCTQELILTTESSGYSFHSFIVNNKVPLAKKYIISENMYIYFVLFQSSVNN